jgi:hypothetical protein
MIAERWQLVPKELVMTRHRNESVFKTDCSHTELCTISTDSPIYNRLVEFFKSFAEDGPGNVAVALKKVSLDSPNPIKLRSMSNTSPRSSVTNVEQTVPQELGISSTGLGYQKHGIFDEVHHQEKSSLQLPFRHIAAITQNMNFFGREDILLQIDDQFSRDVPSKNQSIPKSFVLHGMGGVGKTEIAIEYAHSRKANFDAVLWIAADTRQKLADQYILVAKEMGLNGEDDSAQLDGDTAREMVMSWFANPHGQYREGDNTSADRCGITWLLVLDNADDPDVLYDWLPSEGPGCILVTGRFPYLKENARGLSTGLDLASLDIETAGTMLRKLTRREDEEDSTTTSHRIAFLLGGLPLAITQMSAIILRKQLTLLEFEEYYSEDSKDLNTSYIKAGMGNYQHTIWTTWAVEQLNPPAQALLRILSVLDPDRISEKMLIDGAKNVPLDGYPRSKVKYFEARAELIHSSLITRNMATNELRIHRLVQDVVRQSITSEQLYKVFDSATILVSAVWPYVCGTDPTSNQSWRYRVGEHYTTHICRLETLFGQEIRDGAYTGTPLSGQVFSSYAW